MLQQRAVSAEPSVGGTACFPLYPTSDHCQHPTLTNINDLRRHPSDLEASSLWKVTWSNQGDYTAAALHLRKEVASSRASPGCTRPGAPLLPQPVQRMEPVCPCINHIFSQSALQAAQSDYIKEKKTQPIRHFTLQGTLPTAVIPSQAQKAMQSPITWHQQSLTSRSDQQSAKLPLLSPGQLQTKAHCWASCLVAARFVIR